MSGWLLDTNVASHIIRGDRPQITRRLVSLPMSEIAISSITEAELHYGLVRRDRPPALAERIAQFLLRVDVLAWDRGAAQAYGDLRARCDARGVSLTPLDMMIAAHALAAERVLVTRDKAFSRLADRLEIDPWGEGDG
ncbi:MAG TPA: type II toxin-antitoxin system VapC family toxin [Caulobacteraceae bacterium]|jgi:tRNA(fMet)-specific endonuclease VapC|nr:type II toxin-antitoxin system VapC family toxin [Caulobacteraceae bacterium]